MTKLFGILATGIGSISLASCDDPVEDSDILNENENPTQTQVTSVIEILKENDLDNLGEVLEDNSVVGEAITTLQEEIFRNLGSTDGVDTLSCSYDANTFIISMYDGEMLYYAEDTSDMVLYYTREVIDTVLKYNFELYNVADEKLYEDVETYFNHLQTKFYHAFTCTVS